MSMFMLNGSMSARMKSKEKINWQFMFHDMETGEMPDHFHEMHGKPMHLIVVSEDLSHFVHVHPKYLENHPHYSQMVQFELLANDESADPDNFMQKNMIPFSGKFFVFSEVMPMNYGMKTFAHDLNVTGEKRANEKMVVDSVQGDGSIEKYFDQLDNETTLENAFYKVKLWFGPLNHCGTVSPRIKLKVEMKVNNEFIPIDNLETWLNSFAHAFIIGSKESKAKDKSILHLHSIWPLPTGNPETDERGPWLELAAHSHGNSLPSDEYRMWVQVKHLNRVHTWKYVFNWELQTPLACLAFH